MTNAVVILIALASFLIGYEISRAHRELKRYLATILLEARRKTVPAPKMVVKDTSPGVVKPNTQHAPVTDLSEPSGGVMPMSPRGVALEEARLRGEAR